MNRPPLDCKQCNLQSMAFLRDCTPEQVAMIEAAKTCTQYKKGQNMFYEGNLPLGIHCISTGVVKLVRSNHDGKEQILRFAQAGDFLGYRALIADEPLVATAVCVDDTVACFIPKKVFMELLDQNATVSKKLLKSLCHDLGVVEERVQSLAQKSVRERLAETLLFLQATFRSDASQNDQVISITLPREDIANIVGTATETVIRLLSDFKSDKLIELEGKKIRILDRKALEKISHASV